MYRTCLAAFGVAVVALAAVPAQAGEGPFGGFDLAVAVANFDAPTTESNPNIGALVAAEAGWRFDLGVDLGLSLGFSGAGFGFPVTVMVPPAQGGGTADVDADVALDMLELSAWLFLPVGESLELHGQLGGGPTSGQFTAGTTNIDKDGWGVVASAGLAVKVQRNLAVVAQGYYRHYGFTIDEFDGFTDDLFTYGITVGLGWRP